MSNLPPYNYLDPRVQKTIDSLYEALTELLKEKHYRYIKIQDITKKARINRATFYNHFENMSDFIIFCSREGFRRDVLLLFSSHEFIFTKENFFNLIHHVLDFIANEFSKWHYRWDEVLFEKAIRIEFYYFLSEWLPVENKNIFQPTFGNTPALLVSSSIVGLGMVWCSNGCIEPITDLTERIVTILTNGL